MTGQRGLNVQWLENSKLHLPTATASQQEHIYKNVTPSVTYCTVFKKKKKRKGKKEVSITE